MENPRRDQEQMGKKDWETLTLAKLVLKRVHEVASNV
jgi:hypothetical protein